MQVAPHSISPFFSHYGTGLLSCSNKVEISAKTPQNFTLLDPPPPKLWQHAICSKGDIALRVEVGKWNISCDMICESPVTGGETIRLKINQFAIQD